MRCSRAWGTACASTSTSRTRPSSSNPRGTPRPRSRAIAEREAPGDPLSSVVEDYLKVIYGHTEWQPEPITPSGLAARLGLAPSTVTEMVKKLAAQGLVDHRPYGAIRLTDAGLAQALRMVRRHRLVETWLVSRYGYRWDEVHDEAEVLEHTLSDRLLDAIDDELGRPARDPHGDPIPGRDGRVPEVHGQLASELAAAGADPAAGWRVVRIDDRDPDQLRALQAREIALDDVVTLGDIPAPARAAVWLTAGHEG